jgi:hypothetical protein
MRKLGHAADGLTLFARLHLRHCDPFRSSSIKNDFHSGGTSTKMQRGTVTSRQPASPIIHRLHQACYKLIGLIDLAILIDDIHTIKAGS